MIFCLGEGIHSSGKSFTYVDMRWETVWLTNVRLVERNFERNPVLDLSIPDRLHADISGVPGHWGRSACSRCSRARLILLVHRWEDSVSVVSLRQYQKATQRAKERHWPLSREHAIGRVNADSNNETRAAWRCQRSQLVFDRHLKAKVGSWFRSTLNFEEREEGRERTLSSPTDPVY